MLPRAVAFARTWLGPAVLLGVAPLLLADGARGLWPPLVLSAAACLAVAVLAAPWARLPSGLRPTLPEVVRHRDPAGRPPALPLQLAVFGSALLFLWAQLTALAELARAADWPVPGTLAAAVIVLAAAGAMERAGRHLAAAAAGLAVVGALVPIVAVLLETDVLWTRVFERVVARPRVVFDASGPWAREGVPVRGRGPEVVLRVSEEQRVALLGRGRVRFEPWQGGGWSRDVSAATQLTLHPGDRLLVPDGFPIRFQPGRAIPGAPAAGADWLEQRSPGAGWLPLAGLAVTMLLGALGHPAVHGALPVGGTRASRAATLGAVVTSTGLAAAVLWVLYAVWLTPEVYLGGGVGSEIYQLPARVPALGPAGAVLRDLALLGLAAGAIAAGHAALAGVPRRLAGSKSLAPMAALGVLAGVLAALVPMEPWPLLVAAFGLAASACAPAAVAVCWGIRVRAGAVGAGAAAGLLVFGGLTLAGMAGAAAAGRGWLDWLTTWPAIVAAPIDALVIWLLTPGPRPSARTPLPAELAGLHR